MSLFVFLLFFIQCHGSEGNLEDKLFIKTAIAYDKLQIFLKDYSLKLNMDAMYGIILAEGENHSNNLKHLLMRDKFIGSMQLQ